MVELLAPAGSYESLQAAVNAGADAVYIGGSLFGARAYADNPDEEHLIRGIEYCHLHGRKLYMTVNTLLKETEIETLLYPYLRPYYENGLDGLIVQDLGVVRFVQEYFPELPIHASTQMTVTGADGARLLKAQGITRVVPARELSLKEIRRIIDETGIEVETFIHGAMCYSYSGQCLFSSLLGGRSGNRGRCAQPCRLPYTISGEAGRSGERPSYLLSMKDMCTLDLLPDLVDAGIASMKIEGRMKRPEYTAGVVSVYRAYLDRYQEYGREQYEVAASDRQMLMDLYNRGGFSGGYYGVRNGRNMMSMKRPNHLGTEAAKIKSVNREKGQAVALETLHAKDVLELAPGTEITLSGGVKKGESFSFPAGRLRLTPGSVIHRTRNEQLLQRLRDAYILQNCKEKIKGDLRISHDSPAILNLQCGDVRAEVSGQVAWPAESSPTPAEKVRKQVEKTGNTPFVFETLDIWMEDGLFVNVGRLNELRRSGLAKLEEALLARHRRAELPDWSAEISHEKEQGKHPGSRYGLNVLVTMPWQLEVALNFEDVKIDTIYLDSLLFGSPKEPAGSRERMEEAVLAIQRKGIKCFLNCPPVFRDLDRALFTDETMQRLMRRMDGFLLHTIDELAFLQEFLREHSGGAVLAADDNFYAYNRRAVRFLKEQGIIRLTLPAELNYRELGALDGPGLELNVYGYQPLMQSAQCVLKNTKGCSRIPSVTYLRDRKNAEFPVLNRCYVCCNTIYNSVPLMLHGCEKEIRQLAPAFVRLSFTIEPAEEMRRILKKYGEVLWSRENGTGQQMRMPDQAGTRGHFRRGVE